MSVVRYVSATAVAVSAAGYFGYRWKWKTDSATEAGSERSNVFSQKLELLTRSEQLKKLRETSEYDVLVIGGGATGCGVALDAVTRGLSTALVEKDDFSAGTSSRSTKLVHGGVRYLQKAIMNLDREQYKMVREALHERYNFLDIAPHLTSQLPILLPIYKWWQLPYYFVGIKMYDILSGKKLLKGSYMVGKSHALEKFPMLRKDSLVGGIVYYDGQQNDSRMNLALALTAAREGATIANHVTVTGLIKEQRKVEDGTTKEVVCGAKMKDCLTGNEWITRAKSVINATGPYSDVIRKMDDADAREMCLLSAGIHIVLPDYYSPADMGLLDPASKDGRVIFFLPWEGRTVVGTTDSMTNLTDQPKPAEADIRFILEEIRGYLDPGVQVRRGDVLAAWSGIRPLVRTLDAKDTQSIARNHVIVVSDSNLVTIAGGKWTTYRQMSEDTVDKAIETCQLDCKQPCKTVGFMLEGGDRYYDLLFIRLCQDFGLEVEVAEHLAQTYGDKSPQVAKLAAITGHRWPVVGKKLVEEFPYIEAEVTYAVRHEYACTAIDMVARRTRLAFLNVQAADEALPAIVRIMGKELGWSSAKQKKELEDARMFLQGMGYEARSELKNIPINFSPTEIQKYTQTFMRFDYNKDGHITVLDIRKALNDIGESVSEEQLHDLIAEVDLNKNSMLELDEFLQLMSCLKTGAISNSRLATIIKNYEQQVPVDRSGGGI